MTTREIYKSILEFSYLVFLPGLFVQLVSRADTCHQSRVMHNRHSTYTVSMLQIMTKHETILTSPRSLLFGILKPNCSAKPLYD